MGDPTEPELSPGEIIVGAVIRANALGTPRINPDGSHVFVWAANCYEQIEAALAEEGWMLVRKP